MKIREITIRNFKSFGDQSETISLSNITALVGANSSGKTNVLKALDLFFNYSKNKVSKELFHHNDIHRPIEITVIFQNLDEEERRAFQRNLSPDGTLRIKQTIWIQPEAQNEQSASASELVGDEEALTNVLMERRGLRTIALTRAIPWLDLPHLPSVEKVQAWWQGELKIGDLDFKEFVDRDEAPTPEEYKEAVDRFLVEQFEILPLIPWLNDSRAPTKTNIRNWWQGEMQLGEVDFKTYFIDPGTPPEPQVFIEAIQRFWFDHADLIPVINQEAPENILGWANKLKGNLPRLVFIPAIRHLHEETKMAKTTPYGLLLTWLMGDIEKEHRNELQERINQAISDVFAAQPQVADQQRRIDLIRNTLNTFIHEQFELNLDFDFPPPRIEDLLTENVSIIGDDGYRSPLQEKGQGVQRSVIFAMLRTYCTHRDKLEESTRRNNIFAIEEPEICLHPAVKRATYNLLRRLSQGQDQVIYSSHDGYFVDVRFFDEVRLLRRIRQIDGTWETRISHFPIDHMVRHYRNRYGLDISPESIRDTFNRFFDPAKNEGFFAHKVVLVEGQSEEYALSIYFRALGFDTDLRQVAIINAGSKQHMDCLYMVFNQLGIPCYVIIDGDKPRAPWNEQTLSESQRNEFKEKSRLNKDLLKTFGKSELIDDEANYFFPTTQVTDRIAIFEHEFEVEVHHPLVGYEEMKSEATRLYGRVSKPLAARFIASRVAQNQADIPLLIRDILAQVQACLHPGNCLQLEPVGEG